ncbi:MAG: hypothetical protein QOF76_3661 [Solirubrobacteraceae bacterium]|nr:hypothetical protein [Solirubrobacteraceae bacterium]
MRWRLTQTTSPAVGVLVLSQHIETVRAVALVSSGGFAYLLKDRATRRAGASSPSLLPATRLRTAEGAIP